MKAMKLIRLLADSGGTKTDWYGITALNEPVRFTTASYHPLRISDEFVLEQQGFWKEYDLTACVLEFYGAGCLAKENQEKVSAFLKQLGFENCTVASDLFAAVKACEKPSDWVGICGTGSVLFCVKEDEIVELRGGLGWELGDEGSGFYFGKLLLKELQNSPGKYPEIEAEIEEWKSLDELFSMENQAISKVNYAHLAKLLYEFKQDPFISKIHEQNIDLLFQKHGKGIKKLSLVGSYAGFHEDFFRKIGRNYQIELMEIIARPMDVLSKKLKMS